VNAKLPIISNLKRILAHIPSLKGTKPLFVVMKAIIIIHFSDLHWYLNCAERGVRDTDHDKVEQRSQNLNPDIHKWHVRCHPLISRSVIPICPAFWSPKLPRRRWARHRNLKWCVHAVYGVHTVWLQENPMHANVDGLQVVPAGILLPVRNHYLHLWFVRRQPIRFEWIPAALATVRGNCTRVPYGWYALNPSWVALAASTASHQLHAGFVPNLDLSLLEGWPRWRVFLWSFFAWYKISKLYLAKTDEMGTICRKYLNSLKSALLVDFFKGLKE